MELTARQLETFWAKVNKTPSCWIWTAYTNKKGYGVVSINGKKLLAHRVSFALANGYMPDAFVLHSCDNPSCVNPDHLREGTHCENMEDMKIRLRAGRKLTVSDVLRIRAADGTHREIAAREGVTHRTVGQIKNCQTWSSV